MSSTSHTLRVLRILQYLYKRGKRDGMQLGFGF